MGAPFLYYIDMKHLVLLAILLVTAVTSFNLVSATISVAEILPEAPVSQLSSYYDFPNLSAEAYEVFDVATGEVIFAANENKELPIASVTKLFTAAAVLNSAEADKEILIDSVAVATEGRAGKLEIGQVYTPRELLFPLLLESSNDAATAIAEVVQPINLADKTMADASGLSDRNVSTAAELAFEARKIYQTKPHIFDITTLKQYVGEYTGWINNSPVINLNGYKGGKHGYTEAANHTLIAFFAEPGLNGREIGYVLLGSNDLLTDIKELRSIVESSVPAK